MTDAELISKKAGLIDAYVNDLRTLGRPKDIRTDLREQRFVLHTLQLAAQAALDIASHIVSDDNLGEPATNRELFALLARHNWIDAALADKLETMVGFRNVLVHNYLGVDVEQALIAYEQNVPVLRSAVEQLLAELGDEQA